MSPQHHRREKEFKDILSKSSSESKRRVKRAINLLEYGDYYRGTVKIIRKVKPGPIILTIFDGTGTIEAVAHTRIFQQNSSESEKLNEISEKGSKIYSFGNLQIKDSRSKSKSSSNSSSTKDEIQSNLNSNINSKEDNSRPLSEDEVLEDSIVKIFGKATFHRDQLEIEIKSIRSSNMDFEGLLQERSRPHRTTFSIDSKRYESMKERFISIAQRIRRAIMDQQPILIRHHNDADGICAGLAVEQAILHEMERNNIDPKNKLYRSPSVSPFYDQIDLFRDISKFNRYTNHFGDKSPLILLLDTGSTPENLFALQVLQSFNYECIVVDHHNPGELADGKSVICDYLQFHLNPYLFGWDSQTSGGMLGYELARFIDEDLDAPLYPAVAGVGDRCEGEEIDKCIKKSEKTREELLDMAKVIDYLAFHFRFEDGEGVYEQVFTNEKMVQLVAHEVDRYFDEALNRILPHIQISDFTAVKVVTLNLEQFTQRGKYPPPGKTLGLIHDHIAAQTYSKAVFSMGYFSDGIIIRATEALLPVPELLLYLQKQFPLAAIEGGGHEQAGSIKFLELYGHKILNAVKVKLEKLNLDVD
ncbi:MAG: hypothetical protein K9W44_00160 [Candidatus Lokiarchaeota archaeon]|nr:hypothetical protein [Candidatus Harpocratesius repetitus]